MGGASAPSPVRPPWRTSCGSPCASDRAGSGRGAGVLYGSTRVFGGPVLIPGGRGCGAVGLSRSVRSAPYAAGSSRSSAGVSGSAPGAWVPDRVP